MLTNIQSAAPYLYVIQDTGSESGGVGLGVGIADAVNAAVQANQSPGACGIALFCPTVIVSMQPQNAAQQNALGPMLNLWAVAGQTVDVLQVCAQDQVTLAGFDCNANVYAPSAMLTDVPVYADNAAAVAAGLFVGQVYRNGDTLNIVH